MSRTRKKNPDRGCPNGRKRCRVCQLNLPGKRVQQKDARRDGGRSDAAIRHVLAKWELALARLAD